MRRNTSHVITAVSAGWVRAWAASPAGVITGAHFNNQQIFAEIEGTLWDANGNAAATEKEPATVAAG